MPSAPRTARGRAGLLLAGAPEGLNPPCCWAQHRSSAPPSPAASPPPNGGTQGGRLGAGPRSCSHAAPAPLGVSPSSRPVPEQGSCSSPPGRNGGRREAAPSQRAWQRPPAAGGGMRVPHLGVISRRVAMQQWAPAPAPAHASRPGSGFGSCRTCWGCCAVPWGLQRVWEGGNAKARSLPMPFFLFFPAGKNLYTNEYVAIKLVSLFVVRGGGGERLGSRRGQLFALPSLLKWVGAVRRGAALAARNRGHAAASVIPGGVTQPWGEQLGLCFTRSWLWPAVSTPSAGTSAESSWRVWCHQHQLCERLPQPLALSGGVGSGTHMGWFPLPIPWVFVFILHCCFSPLNAASPCCCQPVKEGSASQTS